MELIPSLPIQRAGTGAVLREEIFTERNSLHGNMPGRFGTALSMNPMRNYFLHDSNFSTMSCIHIRILKMTVFICQTSDSMDDNRTV